jgi:hypothetical protein
MRPAKLHSRRLQNQPSLLVVRLLPLPACDAWITLTFFKELLQESSKMAKYAAKAARILKVIAVLGVIADAVLLGYAVCLASLLNHHVRCLITGNVSFSQRKNKETNCERQ